MPKKKLLQCKYCKGTESFTNDKGITRWGVRCQLAGGYPIRNFDNEAQAQLSIDEWCTGDGRRGCRPYLLKETGHSYNFSGDLLREFDAMEEATVAKQTYYCKCGRTFEKSSTASETGHRMDNYSPEHECYGCPFVVPVTDGWGTTLRVKSYECRASDCKVDYTTITDMTVDGNWVVHVYTLDLPWLDNFIRTYLQTPGANRERDKLLSYEPSALAKSFQNTSMLNGRDRYAFDFHNNKTGRAARKTLFEEFFNEDKTAQMGPGSGGDKERILHMIEHAKAEAREGAQRIEDEIFASEVEDAEEEIQVPTPPPQPLEAAPVLTRNITDVTAEIRFYKAQTVSNIIEIGKRLNEAKAMLEHGRWYEWLEHEVEFSHDTARNFIRIAEEYPNHEPVRDLSYTKLLALLAVPADERDDFIEATHVVDGEEKTVDEMTKRELQRVIKERDEVKQQLAAVQRTAEEQRQRALLQEGLAAQSQNELGVQTEKLRKLKDENRRQRLDIERLESKPIDVAVQQPSDAQMNVMRENIRHEVMQSLALPDTYFAKKGTEEAGAMFMDAIGGAAANGIIALMRMDSKAAAKTLRVYISTLERYTSELSDRLKVMMQVDRSAKEGTDDVDW